MKRNKIIRVWNNFLKVYWEKNDSFIYWFDGLVS